VVILFDDIAAVFGAHDLDRDWAAEALQHLNNFLMPTVLVSLLSITHFRGMPIVSRARANNFVAAALFRRQDSIKSNVFLNVSTTR
jgi:hypothetical protein